MPMPAGIAALQSHSYWHQKAQFALEQDCYSYWTLFVPESGRFTFQIGEMTGEAGFGDLVLCPPGLPFHRATLSPLSFHFIHFSWEPADESSSSEREPLWTGLLSIQDKARLSSNFSYLRRLSASSERLNDTQNAVRQHLLNDIWHIAQLEQIELEQLQQAEHSLAQASTSGGDPLIWQARDYMQQHAFGPLNLGSLAESLSLTPVQLTRRFRAAYRLTPLEFITALRLDYAARLLEETAWSIDQIAQLCGYENGFYLSRLFTRKRGINPSAYRRSRQV